MQHLSAKYTLNFLYRTLSQIMGNVYLTVICLEPKNLISDHLSELEQHIYLELSRRRNSYFYYPRPAFLISYANYGPHATATLIRSLLSYRPNLICK